MKKKNWQVRTLIFLLVVLLLYLIVRNGSNDAMTNNDECQWDIGFIITRHVNTLESNKVWIQCVKQIRKYYPDYPIVILDDNSDREFINVDEQDDFMDNVHVHFVEPEHYKSAELLPYYYNYVNKWFETMIFIQDSIFINTYYDFTTVDKVKFIAHQTHNFENDDANPNYTLQVIKKLDNYELLEYYRSKKFNKACWGMMSVIHYSLLKHIVEKYNLKILLYEVKTRDLRMACEAVLGQIFSKEVPQLETDPSIFGAQELTIHEMAVKYDYDAFKSGVMPDSFPDQPIFKISLNR